VIVSAFAYHSGGGSLRARGGEGIWTKIPGGSGWLRVDPIIFLKNTYILTNLGVENIRRKLHFFYIVNSFEFFE
jgi:hypothetical protein